jgi:hypothetical protein
MPDAGGHQLKASKACTITKRFNLLRCFSKDAVWGSVSYKNLIRLSEELAKGFSI